MNNDNLNFDNNFFFPKEDTFSIFLNTADKPTENQIEPYDSLFKREANFNIFSDFIENNNTNIIKNFGTNTKGKNEFKSNEGILKLKRKKFHDQLTDFNNNITINIVDKNEKNYKTDKEYALQGDDQDACSYTIISNTEHKKSIFKTFKGNDIEQEGMGKIMRLMKNRLSARKCRQKKKSYVENLEAKVKLFQIELNKFQNNQKKEKKIEATIELMGKKENEIINQTNQQKKKSETSKKEYTELQKSLITLLFKKIIFNITPIEIKVFSNKFIKLKEFDSNDCLDQIISKIEENLEILSELYDFDNKIVIKQNSQNKEKKWIPLQIYQFYLNMKSFIKFFKEQFLQNRIENFHESTLTNQ